MIPTDLSKVVAFRQREDLSPNIIVCPEILCTNSFALGDTVPLLVVKFIFCEGQVVILLTFSS